MCMGYAKDIKTWACTQEIGRRDAALQAWGEMLRQSGDGASAPLTSRASEPAAPAIAATASPSFEPVA